MGLEDVCIFGANFLEAEVRRIKKYIFFPHVSCFGGRKTCKYLLRQIYCTKGWASIRET